jgi:hypothetical protein
MKANAESLKEPLDRGSTVRVTEAYRELKFKEGMQTTHAGEPVGTHPDGIWMCLVDYICRDALGQTAIFLEEEADQLGDPLKPLRAVFDRVGDLAQLVERFKLESSKKVLRDISKEVACFKSRIQSLAKPPMTTDNQAISREVHKLVGEAADIITWGQRRIACFSRG